MYKRLILMALTMVFPLVLLLAVFGQELSASSELATPTAALDRSATAQNAEIIFAMDTSGSMSDEFDALCSLIDDTVLELQASGITVQYQILGITTNRDCTTGTVTSVVEDPISNHSEDWGPASSDLSIGYAWQPGYVRLVIPMSDEGPENGNPCHDPGADRDAISQAIAAAQANAVFVSPVLGTGWNSCVQALAEDLAQGTSGLVFYSTDPASDLAQGIVDIVTGAVNPDPLDESEPDTLPDENRRATSRVYGGELDEAWIWEHEQVDNLLGLQLAYHNSTGGAQTSLVLPISRYYGSTTPDGRLLDDVLPHVRARIVLCTWDVDPLEQVQLSINGIIAVEDVQGFNNDWSCQSYALPEVVLASLRFPTSPGQPSDAADPSSNPEPPTPMTNDVVIHYSSAFKSLVYGVRLVIEATRPVILVPGFGAEANRYGAGDGWSGILPALEDHGVISIQPCSYELQVPWWGQVDFDEPRKIYDAPFYVGEKHDESHRRCFEEVLSGPLDPLGRTGTLQRNGVALGAAIQEVMTRFGVVKVNLVGHSKGGLFSRQFVSAEMEHINPSVDNLISISTPHRGGYFADIGTGLKEVCDNCDVNASRFESLVRNVMALIGFHPNGTTGQEVSETAIQDLPASWNHQTQPVPGVRYHSVVATADENPLAPPWQLDVEDHGELKGMQLDFFEDAYTVGTVANNSSNRGQSDIFVTAVSQQMANVSGYETSEHSCQYFSANHEQSSKISDAGQAVIRALGLDPSFGFGDQCGTVTDMLPIPDNPTSSDDHPTSVEWGVIEAQGIISAGHETSLQYPVDGEALVALVTWESETDLAVEIADPSGNTYPLEIITGTSEIGIAELPEILNPEAGTWNVNIAAPNADFDEVVFWHVVIEQLSTIGFDVWSDMQSYSVGDTATLLGRPYSGTMPLLGAEITATLISPGSVTEFALLDDGNHGDGAPNDGLYGAQVQLDTVGNHHVDAVVLEASPNQTRFKRTAESTFAVLPTGASLNPSMTDSAIDMDGNGLYDVLRITATLNTSDDRNYKVVSELRTPMGEIVGTVPRYIEGIADSSQSVVFDFSANLLAEKHDTGPLSVSRLTLYDAHIDVPLQVITDAHTTAQYDGLDFEGKEVSITSPPLDHGVDSNNDLLIDYIEVSVPVEVRRAGTYTATAFLDVNGTARIASAPFVTDVVSLSAPITTTFRFSGTLISMAATDGPYGITNMTLQGPLGISLFESAIGETRAYSYSDFVSDIYAPNSTVHALPPIIEATSFDITWSGNDPVPSSGIAYYEIQYRAGESAEWTDWLTQTVLSNFRFGPASPVPIEAGTTYYFRSRAIDYAGNQEDWPVGDGDSQTIVSGVDLDLSKTAITAFTAGDNAKYRISLANDGPLAASQVTITDTLPVGMDYVSDTSGLPVSVSGNVVQWQASELPSFGIVEFELTVAVSSDLFDGTILTNTVSASTLSFEGDLSNNLAKESTVVDSPLLPNRTVFMPAVFHDVCIGVYSDVAVVMDTSYTMAMPLGSRSRLAATKAAVQGLLEKLELPPDQAALISFDEFEPLASPLSSEIYELTSAVASLSYTGITRVTLALQTAGSELLGPNHANGNGMVVVMAVDIQPGGEDSTQIIEAASSLKSQGVRIYTIGIGELVDVSLLQSVASAPSDYYHVEVEEQFDQVMNSITQSIRCP